LNPKSGGRKNQLAEAEVNDIRSALKALAHEGFAMGDAWQKAHELAQAHEGERDYDRLHALCHRIEGDIANAGYWCRRAGLPVFKGGLEAEAQAILADLD
jgi:hypothetical protein